MQLTRAADYGVRVMMHLVMEKGTARASLTDLAEASEVSSAFLSKVLQRLVHAGFVASRRGKRGGFEILERGRTASLLDILQALDGLPPLNTCLMDGGCHRSEWCAAHGVWAEAQDKLRAVLHSTTIERLARDSQDRRMGLLGGNGNGRVTPDGSGAA
jgi:Rrf2 family protein